MTPATQADLTAKFKDNKRSDVWNQPYIRALLLEMSKSKCAYCETDITEESKYMEVDHFRGKDDFPDLVVSWDNLLPSCKRCNVRKSTHNVETEGMIIDPTLMEPRQHLHLKNYRLHGLTPLGEKTVEVVYLNQSDRLVRARFNVGERTLAALEKIKQLLEDYIGSPSESLKRRVLRGLEELLLEAQPDKEYAATSATVLTESPDFRYLRNRLMTQGLWDANLEQLYAIALEITLSDPAAVE